MYPIGRGPRGKRPARRAVRYLQASNDRRVGSLLCVSLSKDRALTISSPAHPPEPHGSVRTKPRLTLLAIELYMCLYLAIELYRCLYLLLVVVYVVYVMC
jgi:hypothetical protein